MYKEKGALGQVKITQMCEHYALLDRLPHTDEIDIKPFVLEPRSMDNGFAKFFTLLRAIEYIAKHPRTEHDLMRCRVLLDEPLHEIMVLIKCVISNQDQIQRILLNMHDIVVLERQTAYFKFRLQRLDMIDDLHRQRTMKQPLAFKANNEQRNLLQWRERLDNGLMHWMTLTIMMNVCSDPEDLVIEYVSACCRELQNRLVKREADPPKRGMRAVSKMVWHLLYTLLQIGVDFTCLSDGYVVTSIKGMILAAPRPRHNQCRFCGEKLSPKCDKEFSDLENALLRFDTERVKDPPKSIKSKRPALHVPRVQDLPRRAQKAQIQ